MTTTTALDRIGVGIDTARYGHRVCFLGPDLRPVAKPLTVTEDHAGYQALRGAWSNSHRSTPRSTSTSASTPPASTPPTSSSSSAASTGP